MPVECNAENGWIVSLSVTGHERAISCLPYLYVHTNVSKPHEKEASTNENQVCCIFNLKL